MGVRMRLRFLLFVGAFGCGLCLAPLASFPTPATASDCEWVHSPDDGYRFEVHSGTVPDVVTTNGEPVHELIPRLLVGYLPPQRTSGPFRLTAGSRHFLDSGDPPLAFVLLEAR